MKKFIVLLAALSLVGSAMARYYIYDVTLSGAGYEMQEGKGKETYNGETTVIDKRVLSKGSAKGYLFYDEYTSQRFFLMIEKGYYNIGYADFYGLMYWDLYWNQSVIVDDMDSGKGARKGVGEANLYIENDFFEIGGELFTKASESWKWKMDGMDYDETWKFSLTGTGVGGGYDKENDSTIIASKVAVKYNAKLSDMLSDLYEEVYDETGSEAQAVQAVEEALEEFINKKAKVDDADVELEED